MTDRELDALIARAAPLPAGWDDIDLPAPEELPRRRRPRGRAPFVHMDARPRRRLVVAGALAATAAAVAAGLTLSGRSGDGSAPAYAAALVRAAETAPRLVPEDDAWRIVRADQWGVDVGEVEFARGADGLQLNWYPRADRPIERPHPGSGTTAEPAPARDGNPVTLARYDGTDGYRAAWHQGPWTIEVTGSAPSPQAFVALLGSMRPVGVDAWLGAMPASVVRPDARARAVDEMLAGVPIPPGLDVAALRAGGGRVNDRYQLGAEVSGAVACAWIGRWVDARRDGDAAAERQALAAMATSHGWAVLRRMSAEGGYPAVLWGLADAMRSGGTVVAGSTTTVATSYRASLGCPG